MSSIVGCIATFGLAAASDEFAMKHASLRVGDVARTYVIHVPVQPRTAVPLVFSFHGRGSSGERQASLTHFNSLSDSNGFIVVYPDGLNGYWNDGRPQNAGADDLAFIAALIADLSKHYPIDPKRIYATGFSNGATFVQYVGCSLARQIAAIAPVSGYMPISDVRGCRPSRPISVLEIGGTGDPIEPYAGGAVVAGGIDRGAVRSAEATVAQWASNAGCAAEPLTTDVRPREPDDPTRIKTETYVKCSVGSGVVLDTVVGGGHAWPGGPQYLPASEIGVASRQLDGGRAIVDFFYAHPLP